MSESPLIDSIAAAVQSRPEDVPLRLHLVQLLLDAGRKSDWENEQQKERARKKTTPGADVRPDWSDAKNSLTTFFKANPAMAKKVRFADGKTPHVIDLLDPVGI